MPDRIRTLLEQLTLDEKVALVSGVDMWHTPAVPRLGIPPLKVTDGPNGARGAFMTGEVPSACFPCGSALAATWDVELVERIGRALGAQVRSKDAHVLLAPTINIHRTPIGGRNFECMSEDPHLTARMTVAYVRGVQSEGVGACAKHFVANDTELERMTISSDVDDRTLREIYLPPFEAACQEAGVWSLMGAYNRLNGTYCCEHPWLLGELLHDEWGWDGLVVSDWWATKSTAESANAGLDLEMPGPAAFWGDKLRDAVKRGEVAEATLDTHVSRVLTTLQRAGALHRQPNGQERLEDSPELRSLLREAAASGFVLLRNEGSVLPLEGVRSVALVGPYADVPNVEGGGSAQVTPPYEITPADGLAEALPDGVRLVVEPGVAIDARFPAIDVRRCATPTGEEGIQVGYFASEEPTGDPVTTTVTRRTRLQWTGSSVAGIANGSPWSARLRTRFTPRIHGPHTIALRAAGSVSLSVDGLLIDSAAPEQGRGARVVAELDLAAGTPVELEIAFAPGGGFRFGGVEIACVEPAPDDMLDRAVAAARDADVAIVVVGRDATHESEGRDRDDMSLPHAHDELIERVAAVNPRTVVVLNAGSPVAMPWLDRVAAVLMVWYPGQEYGNALADVLLGVVSPSGRLPVTFPRRLEDSPAFGCYPGTDGRMDYGEGVFVGYRHYDTREVEPLFAFGHGLSYTTFQYGEVRVDPGSLRVSVDVANTGERRGAEVVQVYVRPAASPVPRPLQELKAFARVDLLPGERRSVELQLDDRSFAYWDTGAGAWVVEAGTYEVAVGGSSREVRGTATLTLDTRKTLPR